MKKILFAMLFSALLLNAAEWKFAYPEWKFKAVTFSYDDGVLQDRELIRIFDKYNIKATFNVSIGKALKKPGNFIKPEDIKETYKNHEVASHGYLHRTMSLLKDKSLNEEILLNQQEIAKLLGKPPVGFAYPYGRHTSKKAPTRIYEAVKKNGLIYARTCQKKEDFDLPANWMAWSPNCHHNAGLKMCQSYKKFKADRMSVCYIWGHSYEFFRPAKNISCWHIIENICKEIANQPDIWYATNAEIALYVQACDAVKAASAFPKMVNPTDFKIYMLVDGKKVVLPPKSTTNVK